MPTVNRYKNKCCQRSATGWPQQLAGDLQMPELHVGIVVAILAGAGVER